MTQFYTKDAVLVERLQKEFGFKVVGMSGNRKLKTYFFAEDESVIQEKLTVPVITEKPVEVPIVTTVPKATFFKQRGRPKNK